MESRIPVRKRLATALGLLVLATGVLGVACRPPAENAATASPALPQSEAARIAAQLRLSGSVFDEPLAKPDFTLTDTSGAPFDFRAETDGKLTLLFFGYTSCPDICPIHLANLAAVLRQISPDFQRRIQVVFVGVDAPRDTPERMRSWLDSFDARFVGLTGHTHLPSGLR